MGFPMIEISKLNRLKVQVASISLEPILQELKRSSAGQVLGERLHKSDARSWKEGIRTRSSEGVSEVLFRSATC